MTSVPGELGEALRQRLLAVAPIVTDDHAIRGSDEIEALSVGPLLATLARAVAKGDASAVWLLCTAVAGGYPTRAELNLAQRLLANASDAELVSSILSAVSLTAAEAVRNPRTLTLARDSVLIDVNFCAKFDHNTGIQRVVRSTMPHWVKRSPAPTLLAWNEEGIGYRELGDLERSRVIDWNSTEPRPNTQPAQPELVVPWRSTLVLSEVPSKEYIERLAVLAKASGTSVRLIGYDAIPIVSAHSTSLDESDRFAHYLTIVKHSDRVCAISAAAETEFRGYTNTLPAQGLTGPAVSSLLLPAEFPALTQANSPEPARPSILMVGSIEPRKNQKAVIHAAELLWREGLDFSLDIIGGGSALHLHDLTRRVNELRARGRHITLRTGVDDSALSAAYKSAHFVAFPSLHEGYGLPVAEALAYGIPVLTSNYGSTAEIARDGGCELVDPRDDDSITAGMRRLLTDPDHHRALADEAANRTHRTWAQYADELWSQLVEAPSA